MKQLFLYPVNSKAHAIFFSIIMLFGLVSIAESIANFQEKGTVQTVISLLFELVWTVFAAFEVWITVKQKDQRGGNND